MQRDLEDFTRVWFNISGLHNELQNGDVQLGFKWTDTTGSPSIKMYWAEGADGNRNYLESETSASAQLSADHGTALATISGGSTAYIDPKVFANMGSTSGWVYFLFEGVSEGEGKLTSVLKINGTESEAASVDIKLMDVRKMYERVKTTPDGADDFTEPNSYSVADAGGDEYGVPPEPIVGWESAPWGHSFIPDPQEEKQYLVFVHGFNMLNDAVLTWGDTMYKRLWHQGYKGRFTTVKWPTYSVSLGPAPLFYNESDYRAWVSGKGLASYMNSLPASYERKLCAHSMGNIVSGGAFREGMSVDRYAMFNAAVPATCYGGRESIYDPQFDSLDTPDGAIGDSITLGLGFRDKLNINNVENTEPVNFYLPEDNALGPWTQNNKLKKANSLVANYTYNENDPSGRKLSWFVATELPRYLRSFNEAVAYASQSKTVAVGALGDTRGVVQERVNMTPWFDKQHSAQWNWNYQNTHDFYQELVKRLELVPASN